MASSLLFGHHLLLAADAGITRADFAAWPLRLPAETAVWLFWALFLAFAIKLPIFPFHSWQPDTYTMAPLQGTMVLAGVMLKMGLYRRGAFRASRSYRMASSSGATRSSR